MRRLPRSKINTGNESLLERFVSNGGGKKMDAGFRSEESYF